MTVAEAKAALRADLRRARRALAPTAAAAEAAATVATLQTWFASNRPSAVASYLAVPGELDLAALHHHVWSAGLPVWLPAVRGDQLDWHPVRDPAQVRPGAFGVREPDPARVPAAALPAQVVLLVPGVGYGVDGRRLGQGGGFYDRALAGCPGLAIGIGFACQRRDDLPCEAHDRPVAGVILGGSWLLHPGRSPEAGPGTGA